MIPSMIFGVLNPDPRGDAALIRRALRQSGVRWPGGDFYAGDTIGLRCSTRQSGLFEDVKKNTRIVYNGELFNYSELRGELQAAGVSFKSRLDSELVLRAYESWGAACQEKFNGEWAFAVWDGRKRRLFCSRDRFGLRPLYYFIGGNVFAFGSTARILFSCRGIKKEPDNNAIFHYLALNNSELPGGTFFKGIKQLEAGCCLLLHAGKKPEIRRYYSPKYNPEMGKFDAKALKKHSAEFLELLKIAVKSQMVPPYPLGSMLSGGLDSPTIACLADGFSGGKKSGRGAGPGKLKLFSINWKEEAEYIKDSAGAVSFSHFLIRPEEVGEVSWEDMEKTALASEIPLNSQSELGRIQLLKRAGRENVRVLLDGNGMDELLAGYPERYFNSYLNQILCGGDITRFAKEFKLLFSGRLREFGIKGAVPAGFYKTFLRSQSSAPQLSEFFGDETVNQSFFRKCSPPPGTEPRLQLNLQRDLWKDTLALGNWHNPMASIRYRYPFLNHRLAEYAFSLPACYKIHNGWTKYLLRIAMEGILPKSVCWRKEKIGGTVPIYSWKVFLKRNRGKLRSLLCGRKFYSEGFLNQKSIAGSFDALFEAAVSPDTTDVSGLWRFANLELWLRENLR